LSVFDVILEKRRVTLSN